MDQFEKSMIVRNEKGQDQVHFHKPPRQCLNKCLSSGADSAIVMAEDCDSSSDVSSRSASRSGAVEQCTSQRDCKPARRTVSASAPVKEIVLSCLEHEEQHGCDRPGCTRCPGPSSAFVPNETRILDEPVETVNPCLSRPPSLYRASGPHIPAVKSYPSFSRPHSEYSVSSHRCASLHGAHDHSCGPLVAVRNPFPVCSHRSRTYSPYYTVHSGTDSMSCASSQYCYNPNQPSDVRVLDSGYHPAVRPTAYKSDSLLTGPPSIYCMESEPKLLPRRDKEEAGREKSGKQNHSFR